MYEAEGSSPMSVMTLGTGFVLDIVVAGVAAFLLAMAGIPSFGGRVLFVVLLGLYSSVGSNLMDWNYMNYPLRFALEMAGDAIVASVLLGVVLALIVKPQSFEVPAGA